MRLSSLLKIVVFHCTRPSLYELLFPSEKIKIAFFFLSSFLYGFKIKVVRPPSGWGHNNMHSLSLLLLLTPPLLLYYVFDMSVRVRHSKCARVAFVFLSIHTYMYVRTVCLVAWLGLSFPTYGRSSQLSCLSKVFPRRTRELHGHAMP